MLWLLLVITAAAREEVRYLFELCAEDAACRQMYRIEQGATDRLFEFLLRLRTNNTAKSWADVLDRHYGSGDEAMRKRWLHLMRSLTPHCMPCNDAIGSDVGVECVGADKRLVFDSSQSRYKCTQLTTQVARSQSLDEPGTEAHTSALTVGAIVSLSVVLALSGCTTIVRNLLSIRKLTRKPTPPN
jgi:hypothetical protein